MARLRDADELRVAAYIAEPGDDRGAGGRRDACPRSARANMVVGSPTCRVRRTLARPTGTLTRCTTPCHPPTVSLGRLAALEANVLEARVARAVTWARAPADACAWAVVWALKPRLTGREGRRSVVGAAKSGPVFLAPTRRSCHRRTGGV